MNEYAIGMIETYGNTAAAEAIDSAFKSAKIENAHITYVGRGIVTVTFVGDVASVKVAVDCGVGAAKKVGNVLSSHVIARLDEQVYSLIPGYDNLIKKNPNYNSEYIGDGVSELNFDIKTNSDDFINKSDTDTAYYKKKPNKKKKTKG